MRRRNSLTNTFCSPRAVHHHRALPLGRHVVEIGATAAGVEPGTKGLRAVSPEVIFLEVRSPIPWQKDIQRQAGLRIVLEPTGASLDDLLGKRASLSVHGPADRTALIEVRLYDMAGHLAESTEIGRLDPPHPERGRPADYDLRSGGLNAEIMSDKTRRVYLRPEAAMVADDEEEARAQPGEFDSTSESVPGVKQLTRARDFCRDRYVRPEIR